MAQLQNPVYHYISIGEAFNYRSGAPFLMIYMKTVFSSCSKTQVVDKKKMHLLFCQAACKMASLHTETKSLRGCVFCANCLCIVKHKQAGCKKNKSECAGRVMAAILHMSTLGETE